MLLHVHFYVQIKSNFFFHFSPASTYNDLSAHPLINSITLPSVWSLGDGEIDGHQVDLELSLHMGEHNIRAILHIECNILYLNRWGRTTVNQLDGIRNQLPCWNVILLISWVFCFTVEGVQLWYLVGPEKGSNSQPLKPMFTAQIKHWANIHQWADCYGPLMGSYAWKWQKFVGPNTILKQKENNVSFFFKEKE